MQYMREADELEKQNWTVSLQKCITTLSIINLLKVGIPKYAYHLKPTVFVPNTSDEQSLIFITNVVSSMTIPSVAIYWVQERLSTNEVKSLLKTVPNFDWSKPFAFHCSSVPHLNMMEEIITGENGLNNSTLKREIVSHTDTYICESKSEVKLPDGFTCRQLTTDCAEIVHRNWQYNYDDSLEGVRKGIEKLPSGGVYYTDKYKKERLVSWAMMRSTCEIGLTYTFPQFRNLGLAGAATSFLCNQAIDDGFVPRVQIDFDGRADASIRMHQRIGFKKVVGNCLGWEIYVPKDKKIMDYMTKYSKYDFNED